MHHAKRRRAALRRRYSVSQHWAAPAWRARRLVIAAGILAACVMPSAVAAPQSTQEEQAGSVTVEIDGAKYIDLPQPASAVFIANPEVADIQVPDHAKILVIGKRPGSTVIFATVGQNRVLKYLVLVTRKIAELDAMIARQIP